MSEPRSKVDIDDLKETFLECPVCVEHFNLSDRRPRLLQSCLHAFCTQCLQELLDKEGQGRITCPLCRKVEKVPGRADTLPADPVRSNLVEYLQVTQQKGIQCTDCPDGLEATFRCKPCRMYLCNECRAAHRRTKVTRDHRVTSLKEMLDDMADNLERLHFCEVHPKQQLEFYCTTDNKLCCVSCTVIDHSGHKFQKIEETAPIKKQELDQSLHQLKSKAKVIENRIGDSETLLTTIKTEIDTSKSNINAMFDDLKNYGEERRAQLLKQIEEKNGESLMLLQKQIAGDKDTLARVDSTVTYCKQTKTRTDDVELCLMHDSICRRIESISDEAESLKQKNNLGFKFIPENGARLKNFITSLGECKPRLVETLGGLDKEVRMILIGENAPPKILVGNALLRKQSFSLDRFNKQQSESILEERSKIDGHTIVVLDAWEHGSQIDDWTGLPRPRLPRDAKANDMYLLVIPTTEPLSKANYNFLVNAGRNCLQNAIVVFVTDFLATSLVRSSNIEDYIGRSEHLKFLLERVGKRYVILDSGASVNSQRDFLYDVVEKAKTRVPSPVGGMTYIYGGNL